MTLQICSTLCAAAVPLPLDTKIVPPDAQLESAVAALSGRWDGNWGGSLESILVVEEIDAQRATIVYAWADVPVRGWVGGFRRRQAIVAAGETVEIRFGAEPVTFTARLSTDVSTMQMKRSTPNGVDVATFRKIPAAQSNPTTVPPAEPAKAIDVNSFPKSLKGRWAVHAGNLELYGSTLALTDIKVKDAVSLDARFTAHFGKGGQIAAAGDSCAYLIDVPVVVYFSGNSIGIHFANDGCKRNPWHLKAGKEHFLEWENTTTGGRRYLDPEKP